MEVMPRLGERGITPVIILLVISAILIGGGLYLSQQKGQVSISEGDAQLQQKDQTSGNFFTNLLNNLKNGFKSGSPFSSKLNTPVVQNPETSFSLVSDKSSYNIGESVIAKVLVRTDAEASNLFAAKLQFPNNLLEVESIDITAPVQTPTPTVMPTSSSSTIPNSLSNELIGLWKLDENGSTISDSSGKGHNGVAFGSTQKSGGPSGTYRNFAGLKQSKGKDYIEIADAPSLTAQSAITYAVWINVADRLLSVDKAISYIFSKRFFDEKQTSDKLKRNSISVNNISDSDGNPVAGQGVIDCFFLNQGSLKSKTIVKSETWYHIVCSNEGGKLKMYINGNLDNEDVGWNDPGLAMERGKLTIGTDEALPGLMFEGGIDDLAIWNRALSADEIKQLYDLYSNNGPKKIINLPNLFVQKAYAAEEINASASSEQSPQPVIALPTPLPATDYFVQNWVEKTYDNSKGTISIVGGVTNPGMQSNIYQQAVAMATIKFKVKAAGKATISFIEDSAIYANSTNKNILASKNSLSLDLMDPNLKVQPTSTPQISKPTATPGVTPIIATPKPVLNKKGNLNQDSKIDLEDMSLLLANFNKARFVAATDLNGDGKVNSIDYSTMIQILVENKVITRI